MLDPETPADRGQSAVRASPWLWVGAGLFLTLLVGTTLAVWFWPEETPPPAAETGDDDLERLLAVVNPGYVGIETCAECHAARAAEFRTSRHYVACTTAAGVTAPGFHPGRGRYDPPIPGLRFEMTRWGDRYLATAVRATSEGEQRTSYEIGLVYGSGNQRDEMYFAWQDDRLHHIPVAWLFPQGCWGHTGETLRVLDTPPSCLECHNTWVAHIPGTANQYRRDDLLLGVTCERCHGPGREHTAYHRQHPKAAAHAILHPGTLSRERLLDVCAQCHGNSRLRGRPFSYRPGEPLATAYRTGRAIYREDDTTTNQVQYLGESKCFQKSTMTCITCHDPHVPGSARSGCATCHAPAACTDRPHLPEAVRDNCVGCHMPRQIWMNSHYYTTKDEKYLPVAPRSEHRIGVYPEAKQAVLLAWLRQQTDGASRTEADRLAARLTDYWLKQAELRRRDGRLLAAIGAYREALQITPDPTARKGLQAVIARQAELDELGAKLARSTHRGPEATIGLLTRMLELKPHDARAHSELGTLYSMTGRRAEALPHLEAVLKHDPTNASGLTRLAWLAQVEGRLREADELFAQADRIEPGHPVNHHVWGMALAKQKRWAEAEQHFRTTLECDPTHAGANQGLSEALRHLGQAAEAIRFARRAVRWSDPNEAEALLTLADAYAAAGRGPEARRTLEQALALAETKNPAQAQLIRRRLAQSP
jgi:tetratricopeptide (TPR) repeat protein